MPVRAGMLSVFVLAALALAALPARAGALSRGCSWPAGRAASSLFDPDAPPSPPLAGAFASVSFSTCAEGDAAPLTLRLRLSDEGAVAAGEEQGPPARAFIYSDAYQTRASIHKKASFAMLPLFIAEAVIGQQMFNDPSSITSGKQTAHRAIGIGIGSLFAVNTVTGAMNLWEGRKDPNGLMKRTIHATLMMMADVGFLATAATRPDSTTIDGLTIYDAKKNQHMTIAYASITAATIGYVMMLFH
jgi:hypothetical protein